MTLGCSDDSQAIVKDPLDEAALDVTLDQGVHLTKTKSVQLISQ